MSLADETTPIRSGHEFEVARLLDYLAPHIPSLQGAASVTQFRGGQSNPTFLIQSDDRVWVMRKKPPGVLLPSAHQVEREYQVMKALAGTDVPVPRMIVLCEDASVIGTPFYVMEGVEGRVIRDLTLPGLSPGQRRAVYDVQAETLARLHKVD